MTASRAFSSGEYWETRYRAGGTSGMGSVGRLAQFKAATINGFIAANEITSVIDFGCGDTSMLALLELPADYVGVDVSPSALERCTARFSERRFILPDALPTVSPAMLTMALDVIYHLTEDQIFVATLRSLFSWALNYVVIYASNADAASPSPHVRHRRFTDYVAATEPDWRLLAHLPNPYPFDAATPDETSFADFFMYGRKGAPCRIVVPGGI